VWSTVAKHDYPQVLALVDIMTCSKISPTYIKLSIRFLQHLLMSDASGVLESAVMSKECGLVGKLLIALSALERLA